MNIDVKNLEPDITVQWAWRDYLAGVDSVAAGLINMGMHPGMNMGGGMPQPMMGGGYAMPPAQGGAYGGMNRPGGRDPFAGLGLLSMQGQSTGLEAVLLQLSAGGDAAQGGSTRPPAAARPQTEVRA